MQAIDYSFFNILPILFFFIGNSLSIHAQNFSGKIVTEKRTPLEYANVILLTVKDSVFISGTVSSETGEFSFENVKRGEILIQITRLGYRTIFFQAVMQKEPIQLDDIVMTEDDNSLNELVITSSKPAFSKIGNDWVVNVNTSSLASVGNANDVIKRIPGVTINADEITVFGKGTPIIYINNRKLYDKDELARLSSTEIATIELITNPGAKYDAEGKAVLLIKTIKKGEGWSVQLSDQLEKRKYFGNMGNIGINYSLPDFVFFSSYNRKREKLQWSTFSDYTVYADTTWLQKMDMPQTHENLLTTFTSGFDWSITPQQTVGCQYQYTSGSEKTNSSGTQTVWADINDYDSIITRFDAQFQPTKHLFNVFYKGDYGKSISLRFDLDYLTTRNRTGQQIVESSLLENRNVTLDSRSNFDLYAGKLTLEYRLNKTSRFESGAETNQVKGSGFLLNPEQYVTNSFYTNKENKIAGFVNYSKQFDKLSIQMGIRYEYATSLLTTDSIRQVQINRNYNGLYPSFSVSHTVGNTQMGLEFSKKIRRPAFALLSSEDYYVNRFLREKGNPDLQPENIYLLDYNLHYRILDLSLGICKQSHRICN